MNLTQALAFILISELYIFFNFDQWLLIILSSKLSTFIWLYTLRYDASFFLAADQIFLGRV